MPKMRDEGKKSWSHTVHLPKTSFPMRGELPKREPGFLTFWEDGRIFEKMLKRAEERTPYVLHDGPPYANGHIHIGTALNKVLKDMVVKSQDLMGRYAPYRPGWDCHGLPIEHSLLLEKKMSRREITDVVEFRGEAKRFAERFIDIQRSEFKRLGVLGQWDAPYVTMSHEYESAVLRAFRILYKKGYIYRGQKTVSWCIQCETALAEGGNEIEYKDKTSPAVYVALPILRPADGFPFLKEKAEVLVWTTTPWTLPANLGVAFHPSLDYVLVRAEGPGLGERTLLLAQARLKAVLKDLGAAEHEVLETWRGRELVEAGLVCQTPFSYLKGFQYKESIGILEDYVSADEGTGIVHTAPGHGADDYASGVKHGLPILCPVDATGRFTEEAGKALAGKHIFKQGNPAVIEMLESEGRLLAKGEIQHSYQHCWRCKKPIAFRATEQWFLNVSHDGLREKLQGIIKDVKWVPAAGQERISAMVASRPDWCLSRQRLWGTPIPVFWCADCGEVFADEAVLAAVEKRVAAEGSDFWFTELQKPVVFGGGAADGALRWDFVPGHACRCGCRTFRRETDILDVWMDSGASWLAVLGESEIPCELYLEGSDQHRGWFQSSLVASAALEGKPPYRTVLTHGWVLDDKGRAMHKSMGNVVSPLDVIGKLGADVLRLWTALADYTDDVRLSKKLLEGPTDSYRKIRNTFKYLLGNTCDFDPAGHETPYESMPELERYVLKRLYELERGVRWAYDTFSFRTAARSLADFCNLVLSAFYLDVRKDALYTLKTDDPVRRAAQTVMWKCLLRIVNLASPILSFTCEEAWQCMRKELDERGSALKLEESVFLHDLDPMPHVCDDKELGDAWLRKTVLREKVLKALEEARAAKKIGSSLAARVVLTAADDEEHAWMKGIGAAALAELCIVSQLELRAPGEGPPVLVEKAEGGKCPRCWRYRTDLGADKSEPELCARCVTQLTA